MFHYTIGGREVARCIFIEFLSSKNFAIHFLERGARVLKVSILAYRGTMLIQGGWTRNLVGFGTTWLMRITDECTCIEAHSIPMCNVVANTSKLAHSLRAQVTPDGSVLSHKLRCHPAFWPDRIENADKLEARGPSFHCPSVDQAFMTYYLVFRARKRGENYTVTRTF